MGQRQYLPIPVSGPLNTADPSTDVAPGTLLKAVDLATTSWGPRPGGKLMTWVGRLPTAGVVNIDGNAPGFAFDGSATVVDGTLQTEQGTLGNKWTCDVAFHAFQSRSTANAVPVFKWHVGGTAIIEIGFYGSLHVTDANKLYAIVRTYNTGTAATTVYTLIGGTCPFSAMGTLISSNAVTRVAVRVIRDGTTLKLLDSTGSTDSETGVAEGDVHSAATAWQYGSAALNASFNGVIFHAIIRDYAAPLTVVPPMTQHTFPKSKSVRFFARCSNPLGAGGSLYVPDQSCYGSHGLITSSTSTGFSLGDRHFPITRPVQGMGSFVDVNGKVMSAVMVGGQIAWQVAR